MGVILYSHFLDFSLVFSLKHYIHMFFFKEFLMKILFPMNLCTHTQNVHTYIMTVVSLRIDKCLNLYLWALHWENKSLEECQDY